MKNTIGNLPAFSLIIFLLLFQACIDQPASPALKLAIEEVRATYAPDLRVAIFEIRPQAQNDTILLTGETNLPEAHAALLRKLDQQGMIYLDRISILPSPGLTPRAVVNVSVANMRSTPKHSGELATQALLGTTLKVYKRDGDWLYVQTPDGYLGWMDRGSCYLMDDAAFRNWQQHPKVIFLDDYGLVRTTPGTDSERISDLVAGNILLDGGAVGIYRAVTFPDGRQGYVPRAMVREEKAWLASTEELSVPAVIQTARSLLGRPYLWGGTSGKGMDCSGFTKTVFFLHGLVLPRDASQQVQAGLAVPADSTLNGLQAGDFLFFGQPAQGDQREKIRHVGIYLGEGRFIHSGADNPGVCIQSLRPGEPDFAAHRLATFVRARRMAAGSPGVIPLRDLPDFFGSEAPEPLLE